MKKSDRNEYFYYNIIGLEKTVFIEKTCSLVGFIKFFFFLIKPKLPGLLLLINIHLMYFIFFIL